MRRTSNIQHATSNNQGRPPALRSGATRRICVGTVYRDGHLVQNGQLRTHKCMSVQWRGMTDWCQPHQAEDMHDLAAIVRQRLWMAGLRMLNLALRPVDGTADYSKIICVVSPGGRGCERARRVNRMRQSWMNEAVTESALASGGREQECRN
jgi:hypothetical protein